ncbi:uncharacterized protein [Hetaerina americana]|uniref:uncharacterized protein n=1 Tax=Hetaerina americana TaxID=62018 RepID=UPI003A7F433C
MEYNATACVLYGLAVIVFLNIFSKFVSQRRAKRPPPPSDRDQQNGGMYSAVSSVTTAPEVGSAEDRSEGIDHLTNGTAGHVTIERVSKRDDFVELRPSANGVCGLSRRTMEDPPVLDPAGMDEAREVNWKGEGPHVVHLLEHGWSEEDLDELQRPIEVYSWFVHRQSCGCSFELAAILQDKRRKRIADYLLCPGFCNPGTNIYKKVSLIFEKYGTGVRYVTYSHRRRKPMEKKCQGDCSREMCSGLRKLIKINN